MSLYFYVNIKIHTYNVQNTIIQFCLALIFYHTSLKNTQQILSIIFMQVVHTFKKAAAIATAFTLLYHINFYRTALIKILNPFSRIGVFIYIHSKRVVEA